MQEIDQGPFRNGSHSKPPANNRAGVSPQLVPQTIQPKNQGVWALANHPNSRQQVTASGSTGKGNFVAFSPSNQNNLLFNQVGGQKQQSLPRISNMNAQPGIKQLTKMRFAKQQQFGGSKGLGHTTQSGSRVQTVVGQPVEPAYIRQNSQNLA